MPRINISFTITGKCSIKKPLLGRVIKVGKLDNSTVMTLFLSSQINTIFSILYTKHRDKKILLSDTILSRVTDGKAKLVAEKYCDGLGACLGECPQDAIRIVEIEAEAFDEEAVKGHLKSLITARLLADEALACGCPSALIQSFTPPVSRTDEKTLASQVPIASDFSHWPVQIGLVPPTAPFLKGADLLAAADCTPFAYPRFHQDFIRGKTVLVGCQKLDAVEPYIEKFAAIFASATVRSVTVVVMEVPCCQGLPVIVKKGMDLAGKSIPLEIVILSTRGEVLKWHEYCVVS